MQRSLTMSIDPDRISGAASSVGRFPVRGSSANLRGPLGRETEGPGTGPAVRRPALHRRKALQRQEPVQYTAITFPCSVNNGAKGLARPPPCLAGGAIAFLRRRPIFAGKGRYSSGWDFLRLRFLLMHARNRRTSVNSDFYAAGTSSGQ